MGQGGAGEILGLAPLFSALAAGFDLAEKESLALVNGSPCASALIADAVIAMERRLPLVEQVFALSAEAILAPLDAISRRSSRSCGTIRTRRRRCVRCARCWRAATAERRPYQAPVSYRILPRVLGAVPARAWRRPARSPSGR